MTPKPERRERLLTRWLKSPFGYDELKDKTVFADFVTRSGASYDGTGKIRVLQNPGGLLSINLVFTRHDSHDVHTDILFNLSSRQIEHLRKASEDAEHDFEYHGTLTPDNQPEATPEA
jgi:hypothetical protein